MDRRGFLVFGAAGAVSLAGGTVMLAVTDHLRGEDAVRRRLGGCGQVLATPDVTLGPRVDGSFESAEHDGAVVYSVLYPPGTRPGDNLPVVIALHGRGGDHNWPVADVHLDAFLAQGSAVDPPARFAVATVDGGDAVNWHARSSGDDPLTMLADELLPALGQAGLDTERVGLIGWSMGGAGVVLLAERLGAARVAAVVMSSPAIWSSFESTSPGAYDDSADFLANRVDARGAALRGIRTRIDCGDLDPFADATAEFRSTVDPKPEGGIAPGCHDTGFWTRQLPDQLAFLARHVA